MKTARFVALTGFFLLALLSTVSALEASLTIDVSFVGNHNPRNVTNESAPDLTNEIFIGDDTEAAGRGSVTIDLTNDGQLILDNEGPQTVPGLQVRRGNDSLGTFIEVSSYGFNAQETLELTRFSLTLIRAHFTSIVNDSIAPYEGVGDGICGINETSFGSSTGNDEITLSSTGSRADLCSLINSHYDRARIYYELGDLTAPVITNIEVSPPLPINLEEGESEDLTVRFTSSEYPLTVHFVLRDREGDRVDITSNVTVTNTSQTLTYHVSSSLNADDYTLYLVAHDAAGNERTINLGGIDVVGDSDDSGSSRRRSFVDEAERERFAFQDEKTTPPVIIQDDSITLEAGDSHSISIRSTWGIIALALLVTNILVFILILLLGLARR